MIRVLHVVNSMNCGGTENMLMNIYRNIDKEKIQFDFLVHTDAPAFFDEEIRSLGGRIFYAPRWNILNFFEYKKVLNAFFKEHDKEFSIVHGHIGSSSCIYLAIAKKYNLKTIAHSHSANFSLRSVKNIIYLSLNKITKRIADNFFACSLDAGICRYGEKICKSNKFKVINNAIALDKYQKNQDEKERIINEFKLKDSFVVGHIGRFTYAKNHPFIIETFKEILKLKENAKLLLIGEGELRVDFEAMIEKEGIKDKVILTGVRKDITALVQVMDAFIFPSHHEGLGIAAIEAQTMGTPCFINKSLPKDLDINPNVYRLSLEDSPEKWARFISENADNKISAEEAYNNISEAGYDIKNTVKYLEQFYLNN